MPAKKWWRSLSWLQIPKKIQNLHKENLCAISIDYEKYVCTDSTVVMRMLREMGFSWELDMDNSNIEHSPDYSMSLKHGRSDLWTTYEVLVNLPWFAPFQAFSFESYYENRVKVLKSQGGIEFPGAFFRFREIMKEQAPEVIRFYERLKNLSCLSTEKTHQKPLFRRNRVDIAIDVKIPIDQKWEYEYVVPSKNSKRVVHHFNYKKDLTGWQSFSYIPKWVSRWIWIRVYNKILDIVAKNKQPWYPDINVETDTLTRIEIVYYSPYAENEDESILHSAQCAILGTWQHTLHYVNPRSVYSPLSAHTYISRYAKNHWTDLMKVIEDVTAYELRDKWYRIVEE